MLPMVAFITFLSIENVLIKSGNRGLKANSWDVLFSILGNPYVILTMIVMLYLFIISDIGHINGFAILSIIRHKSRSQWWLTKNCILLFSSALYTFGVFAGIFLISNMSLDFGTSWSPLANEMPLELGLNTSLLLESPITVVIGAALLMIIGLFSLGLIVLAISLVFRSHVMGFCSGTIFVLIALAGHNLNIQLPLAFIFIHVHLMINYHSSTFDSIWTTITMALVYWFIIIVFMFAIGSKLNMRRDYVE